MIIAIFCPNAAEAATIAAPLTMAGHECTIYAGVKSLQEGLQGRAHDLLIAEAQTSRARTEDLLRAARTASGNVLPVLLLVEEADLLLSDMVVDDYLVKPMRMRDLLTRVQVLLHRAWPERRAQAQLRFGRIEFDTLAGAVRLDGELVTLTQKEYALALMLFRHLNQPLSRATMLETIWAQDMEASTRTVDTHASRIRSKLGLQADGAAYRLVSVYGYGYVLEGNK